MASYVVSGPTVLNGHVAISGNKNSILKLIPASLLASGPTTLTNVPDIADVKVMCQIIDSLGGKTSWPSPSTLVIDPTSLSKWDIDPKLSGHVRSSIMFLSPLLAKFGQVSLGFPGGDKIGKRGLGTHFDALKSLGATFSVTGDQIIAKISTTQADSANIFLDEASVTATENALILACGQAHETIIENAACEPHVVDLCNLLVEMGAHIEGIGSNTLRIIGNTTLAPTTHAVCPDHMNAGTYAIAAAVSRGTVTIGPVDPKSMRMLLVYLSRFGVKFSWPTSDTLKIEPSELSVNAEQLGIRHKFQTRPWPGFPTDLMSPLIVLATQATGSALLHDWMYETRMFFTDKLVAMGANITLCDPHRVIVTGPTKLYGRHLSSPDIRAGMSLLIAALIAEGESTIDHAEIIERGYDHPDVVLNALGAKIKRVDGHD